MEEPLREGPCSPAELWGTCPLTLRAERVPGPHGRGRRGDALGENTRLLPLPQPEHAGGWTGPVGHDCQIAGMQAGTNPEGAPAAGRSMKSLGSDPLSLFISSKHGAELGTEVPGTEGTRCVVSWLQPR